MLIEILRVAQLFARRFGVDVIPYKPGSILLPAGGV